MKKPMFVRLLTEEEQQQLQAGLHSADSFVLRRCQILLASSQGQTPSQIAQRVGRTSQTVRNVIHAFDDRGLSCLSQGSKRPKKLRTILDESATDTLKDMLHQSPRDYGKPTSIWTLELAAQASFEQGLSPHQVSIETVRMALKRLGMGWKRAKKWIVSPDPEYLRKKGCETG
jgi:transposase